MNIVKVFIGKRVDTLEPVQGFYVPLKMKNGKEIIHTIFTGNMHTIEKGILYPELFVVDPETLKETEPAYD